MRILTTAVREDFQQGCQGEYSPQKSKKIFPTAVREDILYIVKEETPRLSRKKFNMTVLEDIHHV
jgi:hypothetical protein